MLVDSADLSRLCYNAIQFTSRDSSLGGAVLFDFLFDSLVVYASDDYVAMRDEASWVEQSDESLDVHLHLKEVKELEKWLRDKEGEVIVSLAPGVVVAAVPGSDSGPLQIVSEPPDFSGVREVLEQRPNPFTGEFSPSSDPFAIRAERFAKFRLLRTPESPSCKDGYPVDFLWDGRLVYWRCGPALRGVVGPLARYSYVTDTGHEVTGLTDLYRAEPGVLWNLA